MVEDELEEEDESRGTSRVTIKFVTARKARPGIKPGDRVKVVSWFEYEKGGPRIGYNHNYTRISKGPSWSN